MRIAFLGTPAFAVPSLEALAREGFEIPAVFTQPDRPKGRGQQLAISPVKEAALRLGLAVHQPERVRRPEVLELLRGMALEAMVVVGYGQIIPQSIIDLVPGELSMCMLRCCPSIGARRRFSGRLPMARLALA